MRETETVADARRQLEICNACRYCEGFCAVFPAMTLRREFASGDISYLANLCHGCKGCFHACQYSPPHLFDVNIPKTFAELRVETYEEYAWPQPLAGLFKRSGTLVALAAALLIALVPAATALVRSPEILFGVHQGPGAFYHVVPWAVMAALAGATFLFSIVALCVGVCRFWRDTSHGSVPAAITPRAIIKMTRDVLSLRNLGGGGHGCNDVDRNFSQGRRHAHHLLFYGFLLCFASTSVATLYDHFLGVPAPYPLLSLPVQLGLWGGIGMTVGAAAMLVLKLRSDPAPVSRAVVGGDYALIVLLGSISASGLILLFVRSTAAMGLLLCVHFGLVLTLFLFIPYGKMVHGAYRAAALLRNACERR
jgi:citrate/tricarballylate utilization protein